MDATFNAPLPPRPSSAQTGLLIASSLVSETFVPSLAPRSSLDQGIITGLSVGSHYLVAVAAQDLLSDVAHQLIDSTFLRGAGWLDDAQRVRFLEGVVDLCAVPIGCAVGLLFDHHPDEPPLRAVARFGGYRFALSGAAGATLLGGRAVLTSVDQRVGAHGALARFPLSIPLGGAVAYSLERRRSERALPASPELRALSSTSRLTSGAIAAAIIASLTGVAAADTALTHHLGDALDHRLPGSQRLWRMAARTASLAGLGAVMVTVWDRAMQRIEAATQTEEVLLPGVDPADFTRPTVSGSTGSLVPWETLGREGRRHVLSQLPTTPRDIVTEDLQIPDFSIETVVGQPAVAEPVQVYVGLDSAPTARDRVNLALAEMARLGAFDRSLLVLISPTGTGYVNYVALAALQYLTRGDVATVTMQYSKRPSPLSLAKVPAAREQNRLLWMEILIRLRAIPESRRPRVVLFGESLGAHTSQDVFLNWGTIGPSALGIDRALWIGTPYTSGWMHEVTSSGRLDVDPESVTVVNDFGELEDLGPERRAMLRYVMVSHDNDGVTKLGLDLAVRRPRWLDAEARAGRPAPPPSDPRIPVSPRGTPPWMSWRPVTTFFQTLIDMKNAQQPGYYRAWAHDYRADLPRFISEVFDLPASLELMDRLDAALPAREKLRETLIADAHRRREAAQHV
ncbi:alpha/beta-hydrolase family protein [Sanguibacter suarezii]|uniref:alpha/beta-hydrolase family protein n=1 Tax=Sanguibacter suarezii TaxID=60921 RepID=UPI000830D334|nr:alpha/beta-hydrolase family protein [Sanguibacter suarezii]